MTPVQSPPRTGLGPALRKARLLRGKSVEEASRDTRIRPEYIEAIEDERFGSLLGGVYVRGFLRSYSTYLGLDPDKVVDVYNRAFGPPKPTIPDPVPTPARTQRLPHPHVPDVMRNHPSWSLLIGFALFAFAVFGTVGLLSRAPSVPPAEELPSNDPAAVVQEQPVTVAVKALEAVRATVRVDGNVEFQNVLRRGESLSFEGERAIRLELGRGQVVHLTVNGHPVGTAGRAGAPYAATFGPTDFRRSPSAAGP